MKTRLTIVAVVLVVCGLTVVSANAQINSSAADLSLTAAGSQASQMACGGCCKAKAEEKTKGSCCKEGTCDKEGGCKAKCDGEQKKECCKEGTCDKEGGCKAGEAKKEGCSKGQKGRLQKAEAAQ